MQIKKNTALEKYSANIGLSQIKDDILDIEGNFELIGKPGSDESQ